MRVCQPGPVAFQRASVSGDSLRLIATFDSGDRGRPRGLSIAAAVRVPKIFGRTSRAGRALASIALVHSGLSWLVFSGLDRFFISLHLTFIGFAQTDDPRLPTAGRKHHAMETVLDEAKYTVAPFSIVPAVVFPNQSRSPVEMLREVQRQAALRNIAIVLGGILVHPLLYIRIYGNQGGNVPVRAGCGAAQRPTLARDRAVATGHGNL